MNARLDAYLVKKCPTLFVDRYKSMKETCMCWGFECGNGWYALLEEAARKLEPLCRAEYEKAASQEKPWYRYIRNAIGFTIRPLRLPFVFSILYKIVNFIQPNVYNNAVYWYGGPPCRASQVKEKFGTLRFYMTSQTLEMDTIIKEAERASSVTCEQCGKKGKLRGHGWLYTACARHTKKEDK